MEEPRKSKPNYARWNIDKVRYHLDKPPSPRREVRPISDILKDVVDGLEEPQCENILVLRKAWPKIAGQQIAQHSEPGCLEQFTLRIDVDHPGWLPELERLKRSLLKKLQSNYPELRIRKLYFSLTHR